MTIYELYLNGNLAMLENKKVLKSGIITYCEINHVFQQLRKRNNYIDSITKTADQKCVSERTVKRAINRVTK
jgi:hypothetical protein